jgi:hypothetical protein
MVDEYTSIPSSADVMESWCLNFPEPSASHRPVMGLICFYGTLHSTFTVYVFSLSLSLSHTYESNGFYRFSIGTGTKKRTVKYWARLGCWISPRYGPFSLGARFEINEPSNSLIFQFIFRVAAIRGY